MKDPTSRDRVAMLRDGRDGEAHPLTGVGPKMVERVYAEYRDPAAVEPVNPHLHNVPVQIAAERGLPALAAWLWFIVGWRSISRTLARRSHASLPAAALAAIAGMLAAGLFEYNFGDSEFLMLFLVLYAAVRRRRARRCRRPPAAPAAARRSDRARALSAGSAARGARRRRRHARPLPRRPRRRISPEAPVPVVAFDRESSRPGGAANVAHNLAALGARVALVGLVGADAAGGDAARRRCATRGIGTDGLVDDAARPTTTKMRIVTTRNQQVARVDYEDDAEAHGDVEQRARSRGIARPRRAPARSSSPTT